MKYFLSSIFLLGISISINDLFAQQFHIRINGGYNFAIATQADLSSNIIFGESYINIAQAENKSIHRIEIISYSYGAGFNLEGGFAYLFNKNIGLELGVTYLKGGEISVKQKGWDDLAGRYGEVDINASANMFKLKPVIILATGMKKANPYAKLGMEIGMGTVTENVTFSYDEDKASGKIQYTGGLAVGMYAGTGIVYSLTESLSILGEIMLSSMSYSPKKSVIKEFSVNGNDRLSGMTTKQKEIEYVSSYDKTDLILDSQPSKSLRRDLPFSTIGINLGIKYCF